MLDLVMTGMDGQQCLEEILKRDPTAQVLMASGFSENGPTVKTIETGAKGFVHKPYEVRHLLQTVRDILDDK
jgi:two-component system, cell cycle sensor histidine kinase and response regulator CckA